MFRYLNIEKMSTNGPESYVDVPKLSKDVASSFKYDFDEEKPEGFDALKWNLSMACAKANKAIGFKGRDNFSEANSHARSVISALRNAKIKSPRDDKETTALKYLRILVAERKIAKIIIKPDSSFSFLDRKGDEIFEFDEHGAKVEAILSDSVRRRKGIQESLFGFLARKTGDVVRNIKKISKKAGIDFSKDYAHAQIKTPTLELSSLEQGVSPLELVRASGRAPNIVEDKFRKLDVCAAYVTQLLIQEFGRGAVVKSGLIKNGRFSNAWDVKENGLKAGGISIPASTLKDLQQRPDGKMEIRDQAGYLRDLEKFFRNVDNGRYPSLVTCFHSATHHVKDVVDANKDRPAEFRSYNSHVLVCLGRENPKSVDVKMTVKLEALIRSKTGIDPRFCGLLNIKIYKKDGKVVDLSYKNTHGIVVEAGDRVSWQDTLLSDFYHGKERLMGLAFYASNPGEIIMEQLVLNGVSKAKPKYEAADYFHFKEGQSITLQLKERFNLNDADARYYLAALADAGININRISPKTIIPVFDIPKMKAAIDAKGGPEKVLAGIKIDRARDYNENKADGVFTVLEAGKTPWDHFGRYFDERFKGNYSLTGSEKNYILDEVDKSCPTIDLKSNPITFQAGDNVFLSYRRIGEIIVAVKEMQAKQFGKNDYVHIVKAGEFPYGFIQTGFDNETAALGDKTLKYENLDDADKNYLLRVLDDCSDDIDLGLVSDTKGRVQFKHFAEGARLVLRKVDLRNAIEIIRQKHQLQVSPESIALTSKKGTFDVKQDIKNAIDSVFGNDAVIRNCLYFVWGNEQSRGGLRKMAKGLYTALGGTAHSVGEFQIRPTQQDLESCREMFQKHGITPPSSQQELVALVRDNPLAATIVAGMRIKESVNSFKHFMAVNGETPDVLDKNFVVMTVNSYNRSIDSVYRAVFQNWAYNLATFSGALNNVNASDIDSLMKKSGGRESVRMNVAMTFKNVATKLIAEGKIKFNGNLDAEVSKILTNNIAFIQGDLFHQIKSWYESNSGKKLAFVFTDTELARGDNVFSYGRRFLKQGSDWDKLFKDRAALASSMNKLGQEPVIASFVPDVNNEDIGAELIAQKKEILRNKLLASCGINECLIDGNLICNANGVAMYSAPGKGGDVILPVFSKLRFVDVVQKNGVVWAKVEKEITKNKKKGFESGYVLFNKDLFARGAETQSVAKL